MEICDAPALQAIYKARFEEALSHLPNIIGDIPERWHYVDDTQTMESQFSMDAVEASLQRYQMQTFWERT